MPTARELLEQADALMRRNRERAALATREHEPEIPVLTERVAIEAAVPAAAAPPLRTAEPPRASAVALVARTAQGGVVVPPIDDDFPVLTDVVEEIVAPPIVASEAEGEPSDWLDLERVQGAPSITGPAPDSIAVVPPAPSPPAAPLAAGETTPPAAPAHAALEAAADRGPPPAAPLLPPVEFAAAAFPAVAPVAEDAGAGAAGEVAASRGEPSALPPPDTFDLALPAPPEPALLPSAAAAAPRTEPAWEALAEEIRMQVLQRIDIFTDTGLRERLGERLKPVVDRASADLVATINQHVGDLLRAYVAEAIEREIERWRENSR